MNLSGWDPGRAKNLFAGHTVYSIVLEVPDGELRAGADRNRRIGVWAVSTLATDAGGWRPINRVGLPMIHLLFTQYNEDLATVSIPAARPTTLQLMERPSPRQLPGWCPQLEPLKTQAPMG